MRRKETSDNNHTKVEPYYSRGNIDTTRGGRYTENGLSHFALIHRSFNNRPVEYSIECRYIYGSLVQRSPRSFERA